MKYTGEKEFPGDAKFHFWWKNPTFKGDSHHSVGSKDNWKWSFDINFDWGSPNTFWGLSFIIDTPFFFWGLYA